MRFGFRSLASAALSALVFTDAVGAVQYNVSVGLGGLRMTPNQTFAAVGDTVQFMFFTGFHDVVQGDFATPCHVGSVVKGFDSGFMRVTGVEGTTAFVINITNTNPMWFYCSQGNATTSHCHQGMVGVINPPSSPNMTLAMYAAAAKALNTTNETPSLSGGGMNVTIAGINSTAASSAIASATSAIASSASVAASSASAAASSTSKAAAPAVTFTWELMAAAGAVVGGAVAYLN